MNHSGTAALILALALVLAPFSYAAGLPSSYGNFITTASNHGYGEKKPVTTEDEARKLLKESFGKKGVRIGEITEKELLFEAEILDKNRQVIDRVIIDKRTGRIRSIY